MSPSSLGQVQFRVTACSKAACCVESPCQTTTVAPTRPYLLPRMPPVMSFAEIPSR